MGQTPSTEIGEAEQCGRISGDVAWRSQRNELGTGIARERAIEASSSQTATQATEKAKAPIRTVKKISVRALVINRSQLSSIKKIE